MCGLPFVVLVIVLFAVDCLLCVVCSSLFDVGFVVVCLLLVVGCFLSVVRWSVSFVRGLLFVVCCLLCVVWCLFFADLL